jgi:hypothetical protein
MKFIKSGGPIQQGVVATLWFAFVGVLFRFGYSALDPESRSWAIVAIAPLFGLAGYVRATGRNPLPPELMIALGYVAILVYVRGFLRDGLPGPLGDWILWGLIVTLPVTLIVWGVIKIRQRSATDGSAGTSPVE